MSFDPEKLKRLSEREPKNWERTNGDVWCGDYDRHGEPVQVLLATTDVERAEFLVELRNSLEPLLEELFALREASGKGAGSDDAQAWQPIETAPKDGTHVALYLANGSQTTGMQYEGTAWALVVGAVDIDYDEPSEPTHWRALPAPPEASPAPVRNPESAGAGLGKDNEALSAHQPEKREAGYTHRSPEDAAGAATVLLAMIDELERGSCLSDDDARRYCEGLLDGFRVRDGARTIASRDGMKVEFNFNNRSGLWSLTETQGREIVRVALEINHDVLD